VAFAVLYKGCICAAAGSAAVGPQRRTINVAAALHERRSDGIAAIALKAAIAALQLADVAGCCRSPATAWASLLHLHRRAQR